MLRVATAPPQFDRNEREIEFSRALAFSDGVFAFAITLLVTTLDVPRLTGANLDHQLWDRLGDLAPQFVSFFLSFAIIGLMWIRHHGLFSRIRRLDQTTLWLNLLALAFVVLIPFSTEVLGKYNGTAAGVGLYAVNMALAGFGFTLLWWHCVRSDLLDEEPTPEQIRLELLMRLGISFGFLVSIPIALVNTTIAEFSWFGVVLVQRYFGRRAVAAGRIEGEVRER
jgi:TMEM175 potassium channel family protein